MSPVDWLDVNVWVGRKLESLEPSPGAIESAYLGSDPAVHKPGVLYPAEQYDQDTARNVKLGI